MATRMTSVNGLDLDSLPVHIRIEHHVNETFRLHLWNDIGSGVADQLSIMIFVNHRILETTSTYS